MIYRRKADGSLWVKTKTPFPVDGFNFTKKDNPNERWITTDETDFEVVK